MEENPSHPRRHWLPLMLALAVVPLGLGLWPVLRNWDVGWDFLDNLWGPAYLLLHGSSPYAVAGLFPGAQAIWFPQIIGLLFPLGWLDMHLAKSLWMAAAAIMLLIIVDWVYRREGAPARLFPVAALGVVFFPAVLFQLTLGQCTLLVLLLFLLATQQVERQHFLLAGLLVALALAKPQLAVLVGPGLLLAAWRSTRWRGALAFAGAAALGSALMTLPLWIGYPTWPGDFLRTIRDNPSWYQPTLYTLLETLWGKQGWILPALLSAAIFLVNLRLWWKYPPAEALPWSLALTTLASPYVWTWDFVLWIPLLLQALLRYRTAAARLAWTVGCLLGWGLMVWTSLMIGNKHTGYVWVPWYLLFLLLVGQVIDQSRSSTASSSL